MSVCVACLDAMPTHILTFLLLLVIFVVFMFIIRTYLYSSIEFITQSCLKPLSNE